MNTTIFCIASTEHQAQDITKSLRTSGFLGKDISLLFPDRLGIEDFISTPHPQDQDVALTGVAAGGLIGGTLGWTIAVGALAIPGVGPFIAAGPIMALLAGAAVGATAGGIAGALTGMGMLASEAKRYADKVEDGHILLAVEARNVPEVDTAKQLFHLGQAQDIASNRGVESEEPRRQTKWERYDEQGRSITMIGASMTGMGANSPRNAGKHF